MLFYLLPSLAMATCPASESIQGNLTCSSNYNGFVLHTDQSDLGGSCEDGACYSCGEPYDNEAQIAPEAVYTFYCQRSGTVLMEITDLPCDLDIYVLDDSCDPYNGCVQGSTSSFADTDSVEFDCDEGALYYIVVEAYGTNHLDVASGPCTDDGTATGAVFSPSYTLSFDVSQSTGCLEDCSDGADNDLDGPIDCADDDCWREPSCCDVDGDGAFSVDCMGTDCDDNNPSVYNNAPEDGGTGTGQGDGVDNDCDNIIDEGTLDYDDDGDGLSENQGDCDDNNDQVGPHTEEVTGNGIDDDCDPSTADVETTEPAAEPSEEPEPVTEPASEVTEETGNKTGSCGGCAGESSSAGMIMFLFALAVGRNRRRR